MGSFTGRLIAEGALDHPPSSPQDPVLGLHLSACPPSSTHSHFTHQAESKDGLIPMAIAFMMGFICFFCLFKRIRERKGTPRTTELRDSWNRSGISVSHFLEPQEDTDDIRGGAAWARGSVWL